MPMEDAPAGWRLGGFGTPSRPWLALAASRRFLRPRSVRILIGDLMWECDPSPAVAALSAGAAALHVVQLLASGERAAEPGRYSLEDAESGETVEMVLDDAAAARYATAFAAHQQGWSEACAAAGAVFVSMDDADVLSPDGRMAPLEESGLIEPGR